MPDATITAFMAYVQLIAIILGDYDAGCHRVRAAGVAFLIELRTEPYGRVVAFRDIAGNRWDLAGPADSS